MAYIPDLPIIEKLRYMCERGVDNMGHPFFSSEWMRECSAAVDEIGRLRGALDGLLERYTELVNSGDAGFWDPEKEPVVLAAREALGPVESPKQP